MADTGRTLLTSAIVAICAVATAASQQTPPRDPAKTVESGRVLGRVVTTGPSTVPIRNVVVTLTDRESASEQKTLTDDEGRFAFDHVRPGRFTISAARPAYVTSFYGATAPGRAGTPIVLSEGNDVAGITIAMPRGGVIAGVIRDQNGDAVPNARVMIAKVPSSAASERQPLAADVLTDDRGAYRAYGLLPGPYLVAATFTSASAPPAIRPVEEIDQLLLALERNHSLSERLPVPPAPLPAPDPLVTSGVVPIFYPGTANRSEASPLIIHEGEERAGVDLALQPVRLATVDG